MPQHIDYDKENEYRVWWLNNTGGTVAQGLTVRDYFAAKVLSAIANEFKPETDPEFWGGVAEVVYAAADAMMKERLK